MNVLLMIFLVGQTAWADGEVVPLVLKYKSVGMPEQCRTAEDKVSALKDMAVFWAEHLKTAAFLEELRELHLRAKHLRLENASRLSRNGYDEKSVFAGYEQSMLRVEDRLAEEIDIGGAKAEYALAEQELNKVATFIARLRDKEMAKALAWTKRFLRF